MIMININITKKYDNDKYINITKNIRKKELHFYNLLEENQ
jgi:hypothetical protein